MTTQGTAIVAVDDLDQESMARVALLAAGLSVRLLPRDARSLDELFALAPALGQRTVLVLDPARLARFGHRLDRVAAAARTRLRACAVIALFADRQRVLPTVAAWAVKHGIGACIARLSRRRLAATAGRLIDAVLGILGREWDASRLRDYASALLHQRTQTADRFDACDRALEMLERSGVDAAELMQRFAGANGVECADRRWRGTVYPDCFIGEEAVGWLARELGIERARATEVGQALLECDEFYHVAGEQPLRDGHYYYRLHRHTTHLAALDLDAVLDAMCSLSGVTVANRHWHGMAFARCFIGTEAAQWLARCFRVEFGEAVTLGQALLETHAFRHVADEHDFVGTGLFYRFLADQEANAAA
jgi:hypothetical protein